MSPPAAEACPQPFVDLAERLVEVARDIVVRHFRQPLAIERKADESVVTVADRDAEAAMRALIASTFPDHGIVGEEHGADRPDAEHVWVLDPVDGTKRFISGHPQFGILIALLRRGEPVLGIIDMPVLEERWLGLAGRPTVHTDRSGARAVHCRACAGPEQAVLYATSPEMFVGADHAGFERLRTRVRQPVYGSECYGYGLLASGFVDLVVEASLGVYDYLPLVPVVRGAGGIMTDWRGAPLGLGSDGRVVAAGDARCHGAALALLGAV